MSSLTSDPMVPVRKLHIVEEGNTTFLRNSIDHAVATVGSEIKCDKDIFDSYSYEGWKNIHHDLLIVCAAVEYADRRWARSARQWQRRIHLTVPVFDLATWLDSSVLHNLRDTLRHLTGDSWHFNFIKHEGVASNKPRQRPLFPMHSKEFAIAYSDGLDSLCVSGLYDDDEKAVCVRVAKHMQHRLKGERPFDRLPFDVCVKPNREASARSRGFKFAAITAIAAQISNVNRIIVPESGQGALGPVLVPLTKIYPDYRNHPTFFRRMEQFIQATLGIKLTYEQPRLWHTKGQTIAAFLAKPGMQAEQVINTRSCWQQRFNVRVDGKLRQCGVCAACQLRRMSLHAAGIDEPTTAYAVSDLKEESFSAMLHKLNNCSTTQSLHEYGYMGTRHLQQLADLAVEPDAKLKPYAFELAMALGQSTDDVLQHLREMLRCHSQEWEAFVASHGEQSFVKMWAMGGRHG